MKNNIFVMIQRIFLFAAAVFVNFFAGAMTSTLFKGSNSHVNKIIQDHSGYIWIATDNGLTRFDGFNSKTFTRNPNSPSLLNNIVLTVMEDSHNNIWVGTPDGIQRFIPESETFETPRQNYPGIPEFTYVNSIIEDSKGNIWFTTSRSGIICFKADTHEPVWYSTTNSAIASDKSTIVFEDKFGNIWIGTNDNGVSVFNPSNNTMTHYRHNPDDEATLSGNNIYSIAQAPDGLLFVASFDGGIDTYNYRTHRFTRNSIPLPGNVVSLEIDEQNNILYIGTEGNGIWTYDLSDTSAPKPLTPDVKDFDISHAKIHDITVDRSGGIWAAVYQRGALLIQNSSQEINNIGHNPFNSSRNIGNYPVLSILKDSKGLLWIGTDGDGIYHTDKDGNFKHLIGNLVESNVVLCLFEDNNGDIWAGSYHGGLSKYNQSTDKFIPIPIPGHGNQPLEINTIAQDSQGRLWLGTNGNGICIYNPTTGVTEFLRHSTDGKPDEQICGNSIHSILFDRNGNVWIGSSDAGLSLLRAGSRKFEQFNLVNRRLNNNCVYSIVEDQGGTVWVATATGLVSISDGKTTIYNTSDGIPEAPIYGLILSDDGNLWFSNSEGISCFDIQNRSVTRHSTPTYEFKRGAAYSDDVGRLYFGGVGGVIDFLPDSFNQSSSLTNVEFHDISYVNDNGTTGSKVVRKPILSDQDIVLNYDSNTFRVSFGAFEYVNPQDVSYYIMLENYNDTWLPVPPGAQSASFSKVPPGKYNLKVKASLGDSVVEKSIPLIIKPPFFLSPVARFIYFLLFILCVILAYLIIRARRKRRAEHHRLRQKEKVNQDKLQFFTDISHEVRTPLTLILSPIASLKKSSPDKRTVETLEMMESNGHRILRMIDQVLDLRKYDSNMARLQVSPTNIRDFIAQLCSSFTHILQTRNINFSVNFTDDVPETILIDRDKIDKVIFNVVSNAIRFTPDGGRVGISVDVEGTGNLRIRISDSGPGIPPENQEAIFDLFYQVQSKYRRGGTGIGLHLSRKMMELHRGSIFVEDSSPDNGTTFTVIIPLGPDAFTAEEKAGGDILPHTHPSEIHFAEPAKESEPVLRPSLAQKPYTILIVEDDLSILEYLANSLSAEYNVITATNGALALEETIRHRPHCIVTDIMMDTMDGLELCRKIRANPAICETPIIVLTAKASDAQRIEGIEAGADSYITKPFSVEHLRAQIAMLIHSRRIIQQKFAKNEKVNENVATMKSSDDKLLERIESVVIKDLSNPDLNVEYIASEIGVSRSHLHRRLKELTGVSPSTYIKQARMRHAAILLIEKRMNVSEVAYATGYNTLSHFSTAFKEFYGMSPTYYLALNVKNNNSANIEDKY